MVNGWMDGKREEKEIKGHDYLILKLGKPGRIYKVDVDTSYFNGISCLRKFL